MAAPYRPMLLSPTARPPAGDDWAHESKLDGWRCIAEVTGRSVRLWSRHGKELSGRLPELAALGELGNVVLDGELVVATKEGRADFDLLTQRMNARRPGYGAPVTLYTFDVLRLNDRDVTARSWRERRNLLEDIDVPGRTEGAARLVTWSADGNAMHQATAEVMAEGTVSKRLNSPYVAGRSRHWLKAKHTVIETLQVAGWRPSTPSRPGGLIIAENDEPIAVATLAIPESERAALIELIRRFGRQHPSGSVTIPADRITATVRYTSRTPTHGHLRESVVVSIHPPSPKLTEL